MLEELKEEVFRANLALRDHGLVVLTWGNASGIDREKGLVVIKPSGVGYEVMKPSDMVVVDLYGNIIEGELDPSSDTPTHLELYRRFPSIGGVVHTHSTHATAFAQARMSIPTLGTTHADHFYGDVPCTEDMSDADIADDYELNTGKVIVDTFRTQGIDPNAVGAVLVASHGVFTWGKNATKAEENALVVEKCAEMAALAMNLADTRPISRMLLDKHYLRKHGKDAYYGQKTRRDANISFDRLLSERKCGCGKTHTSSIKKIVMERGAICKLPEVITSLGTFGHIYMIADENTYKVAGEEVERTVCLRGSAVLAPKGLHADEKSVEAAEAKLPADADLLLAVGSGTVHDITRYVAYKRGIEFISVPTAASVDGFVSSVAAMTWHGVKKTLTAKAPLAMVADIDIIADAPMRLSASGVGDMLGKYTALLDWKVGNILTGEYICPYIISLIEDALDSVRGSIKQLAKRDRNAVSALMYGLVLSGLAMQFSGNSRPASGAEHHISHFIEMTLSVDECDALHGEKVGVGLVLVSELYHAFASMSNEKAESKLCDYTPKSESFIKESFGALSDEIIRENECDAANGITKDKILDKIEDIKDCVKALPSPDELRFLLSECGAPTSLRDIGIHKDKMKEKLYKTAPLVRNRLTLMRLLMGCNAIE